MYKTLDGKIYDFATDKDGFYRIMDITSKFEKMMERILNTFPRTKYSDWEVEERSRGNLYKFVNKDRTLVYIFGRSWSNDLEK